MQYLRRLRLQNLGSRFRWRPPVVFWARIGTLETMHVAATEQACAAALGSTSKRDMVAVQLRLVEWVELRRLHKRCIQRSRVDKEAPPRQLGGRLNLR